MRCFGSYNKSTLFVGEAAQEDSDMRIMRELVCIEFALGIYFVWLSCGFPINLRWKRDASSLLTNGVIL
jgi:hypothetical protein